ncbi:DNA recombination protein RmuC [Ramlibacter rhizophilus]|uniref:DNA recombination protein RmuC n=1 Tax=Ramlibacter rhizophilus TaxID=1781167 RepID=A0A4Z0C2L2_9BURK|nr:DNA recombination protein RmuC [Ramlibacter rhizophilus]TFZ04748.1 DNA recombination protein RmuC [Ramlibacter rhizophilus]
MDLLMGLALAAAGMCAGAAVSALMLRLRSQAILQAAVAQGRSALEIELAAGHERLLACQGELAQARAEVARLGEAAERWRKTANTAAADQARLAERASRLSALEAESARQALQVSMSEEQLRRLAASEAHKDEALRGAQLQLQQQELAQGALQTKLEAAVKALHESSERQAVLREQVYRATALEQQLRDAQLRWATTQQQLADLRESAALEHRRLAAELSEARTAAEQSGRELAAAQALEAAAQARVAALAGDLAAMRSPARREPPAFTFPGPEHGQQDGWAQALFECARSRLGLTLQPAAAGGLQVLALPQGVRLLLDAGTEDEDPDQAPQADVAAQRSERLAALRKRVDAAATQLAAEAGGQPHACLAIVFLAQESQFLQAVAEDEGLFAWAWQRQVMIAGPTTLYFTLWLALFAAAGAPADEVPPPSCRTADFAADLEALGEQLAAANEVLHAARARLRASPVRLEAQAAALLQA